MRTYGRVLVDPLQPDGPKRWVIVETNSEGYNDMVYLTTLAQVLKLNLGESPFWANYGVPARDSVFQQIMPDFSAVFTQQQFAAYFANLQIAKRALPTPVYDIAVTTNQGVRLNASLPVPT